MKLLDIVIVLVAAQTAVVAQDRAIVHEAYGGALYEGRVLPNGLGLEIWYSADGSISDFYIGSEVPPARCVSHGSGETPKPPIDEAAAREALGLLFTNTASQLRKLDIPVCGMAARYPGRADSYRLGRLFVSFTYDDQGRLTSIVGLSGILGPESNEPPN